MAQLKSIIDNSSVYPINLWSNIRESTSSNKTLAEKIAELDQFAESTIRQLASIDRQLESLSSKEITAASSSTLGGIKLGFNKTGAGTSFPLLVDSENRAYTNIDLPLATSSVKGLLGPIMKDKIDAYPIITTGSVGINKYLKYTGNGSAAWEYLPSYVDDIVELIWFGTTPPAGESPFGSIGYSKTEKKLYVFRYGNWELYGDQASGNTGTPSKGKIYYSTITDKSYRWSGTTMLEIPESSGGVDEEAIIDVYKNNFIATQSIITNTMRPLFIQQGFIHFDEYDYSSNHDSILIGPNVSGTDGEIMSGDLIYVPHFITGITPNVEVFLTNGINFSYNTFTGYFYLSEDIDHLQIKINLDGASTVIYRLKNIPYISED